MSYADSVKEGFGVVHRNWPLILMRVGASVLNCLGLVIFVGIPLAVAVFILGFDLSEASRLTDFLSIIKSPSEIAQKYMGLILIVTAGVLIYLTIATFVWIFVFGASMGVLADATTKPSFRFTTGAFFAEGRRLFKPILGYTAAVGLIMIGGVLLFGLLGGVSAALLLYLKETGAFLAVFAGVFIALFLLLLGLAFTAGFLALTLYGSAMIAFKGGGAFRTMNEAFLFLKDNPSSFGGYCLMLAGYMVAAFAFAVLGYPFQAIPILNVIFIIPLQLLSTAVHSYLGLVMSAAVLSDFRGKAIAPYGSTPGTGTSHEEAGGTPPSPSP
jgi:hypothetical protein